MELNHSEKMSPNFNNLQLVLFDKDQHLKLIPEITKLLHTAYAPLAQQGLKYLATHQSDDVTLRRLSKGWSFLGFYNDELISTITLVKDDPHEPADWYQRPDVFFFTQFAVHPKFQKYRLGSQILQYIETFAKENGATELACDTSEKATQLISLYLNRGFRIVQKATWSETNYESVVMSKGLF